MILRPRWIPTVVSLFVLTYVDQLLKNIVAYNQIQYHMSINRTIEPLPDIVVSPSMPTFTREKMVNTVNVMTGVWVFGAMVCWVSKGRKIQFVSEVLAAEILLVPIVSVFHLFTVVPDSYPNCLVTNEIPQGTDIEWVFGRLGRGCGNTLWSSNIAQIVIFLKLYEQTLRFGRCSPCCHVLFRTCGMLFASVVIAVAVVSQYNYSAGVLCTIFVTTVVCTHQVIPNVANWCFVKKVVEKSTGEEKMPLNVNRVEL